MRAREKCAHTREREMRVRKRERSRRDALSTSRWNMGKDGIYYRFHIL